MSEQCLNNIWTMFEKCLNKCLKTNKQIFDWLGTNIERTNVGFSKCLIDWEQTNKCLRTNKCLNNAWTVFERCLKNVWTNVWKQTNVWEQTLRKQMLDLGFYQRIDLVTDLLGNDRIGQLGGCWPSGQGECGAWLGLHFTILRGGVLKEREREGVVACVCSKFLQNCKHRDKRKILTKLQTQRQTQNSYKTANTETNAKTQSF